jgi:hypothetical protein
VLALDARLARLRSGVADLEPDELAAAIARIEAKRVQLLAATPAARLGAKISAMLPQAAALLREQIEMGLDGDAKAAAKARIVLRGLFGGPITMRRAPDGSLWADYALHNAMILNACGTYGSGGAIIDPATAVRWSLAS